MGLFDGENLVDVPTPDGRTIKIPASLVPPSLVPPQPVSPPSVTGGALPTEDVQAVPPQPVTAPPPATDMPPVVIPSLAAGVGSTKPGALEQANKAFDKQQSAAAAQAASPAGQMGAARGEQKAGIADEQTAVIKQADVDAAGHLLVADAYKKRNDQLDMLFQQRQQQAQADLEAQQQKAAELEGMRKKIAGTKIDRSIDHPILAAIGVALAGLGSALQHRYDGQSPDTTAIQLVFKAIDRKVASQMADLDQQKTVLGLTRDELANLKDKASSRLALNNLLIAGESDRAARQVEEIAARMSSEKAKADALRMVAQLRQRGADLTMAATQAQLQYDQRDKFQRQDLGFKYASLGEQSREHNDEMQIRREQIAADLEKALAAANAQGGSDQMKQLYDLQKDNETRGVGNVATGEPLLQPEGIQMMDQASSIDDQANKIEVGAGQAGKQLTPEQQQQVDQMRQQASALRGEARLKYTYRARDPVQAGKLSDEYAAGQSIVSLTDDVQQAYDKNGRSYFSTDSGRAFMQAKSQELMMYLKTAWQLGVLSKQDMNAINNATGGDPTKGWTAGNIFSALGLPLGEDPEAFKARLTALAKDTESGTISKMRADQYRGPSEGIFHHKTTPQPTPEDQAAQTVGHDKTPLEIANANESTNPVVKKVYDTMQLGGAVAPTYDQATKQAENSGSLQRPGLSPAQAQSFDTLLQRYKGGAQESGKTLVDIAVQQATRRPDLALAWMHNLRDADPALYGWAREQIQGPLAKQLDSEELNLAGAGLTPTPLLVLQYNTTRDPATKQEIVRRATAGDKVAQKAALDIVMSGGK